MRRSPRIIPIRYLPDPASRLAAHGSSPGFVYLDSCAGRTHGGRYDIISSAPTTVLSTRGYTTEIRTRDGCVTSTADPFELVRDAVDALRCEPADVPFCGGAIGYYAYDLGRRIERLPELAAADIDIPDMVVGIYDWAIVVDHETKRSWLVAQADSQTDLDHWRDMMAAPDPVTPAAYGTSFEVTSPVQPEITFAEYAEKFARIKRYIIDGDCYQVNLAQRFSASVRGASWDAYLRLRNLNPAPFSAYLRLEHGAIMSSSPERFLSVQNRQVETKPIKGTRPRSADGSVDRRLADELRASTKDRAENVMIVDLLRNDLGKSCAVGSVVVPDLFAIESYATVHHLVSTVRGTLAGGVDECELLRGCFPGGSITGAPKLRAMEIIEELEPCRRTVYCGAIGYLSADGTMDTNIAIRTLVHHHDRMYCWAGGGIVADSELDAEYRECLDKAAAMLDVFTHAEVPNLGR